MRHACAVLASLAALAGATPARADDDRTAPHLSGDLGVSVDWTQHSAPGQPNRLRAWPYAYADYGRLFVREDTFGVKLVPMGWGALELAGRISTEGADNAGGGWPRRTDPRPAGLGTFQETPWGGVFLDAFVDTVSGGSLLEASYAAQWSAGPLMVYPQVGVARRSARYVAHLYGTTAAEGAAYTPGAATTPSAALSAELTVAPGWVLVAHVQREAFDRAIEASPRVSTSGRTSALLAFVRRFD